MPRGSGGLLTGTIIVQRGKRGFKLAECRGEGVVASIVLHNGISAVFLLREQFSTGELGREGVGGVWFGEIKGGASPAEGWGKPGWRG